MRGKNTVRRLVAGEADVRTITTTMRMPREKNEQIRNRAREISISQNAFMLILLDLG